MKAPKGYTVASAEPATAPDAEVEDAARLMQTIQKERVPEDPATPIDAYTQRIRIVPPSQWRQFYVARDAKGALAGYGVVGRQLNEPENAHVRWFEIDVHPTHRRRGIGRALFAGCVEACAGQGADLVFITQGSDRVPAGEAFARAMGMTAGLPMKLNQLDLRDVDRARLAEWARIESKGYRLERIDGTVPDRLVRPMIDASEGMNDAPRGELKMGDWKLTERQLRDRESFFAQAGIESWLILAMSEATGEGAGFTEVTYDPKIAHVIQQSGTAVIEKHRGHRLGLWMKAVMLERILRERPQARFVRTGNANANAQMIGINQQLGFRHAWSTTLWQIPLADARKVAAGAAKARA